MLRNPCKFMPYPIKDLPHKRHPEFISIYASNVAITGSFYDIGLIMGDPVYNYEDRSMYIEDWGGPLG